MPRAAFADYAVRHQACRKHAAEPATALRLQSFRLANAMLATCALLDWKHSSLTGDYDWTAALPPRCSSSRYAPITLRFSLAPLSMQV